MQWARIVGVVVAVDEFQARRVFTVDDGSGVCIEAVLWLASVDKLPKLPEAVEKRARQVEATEKLTTHPPGAFADIDVGVVVDVKGKLIRYREDIQIRIERMVSLETTQKELTLWEKRAGFRRQVLDTPWVLSKRDVRRAERAARAEIEGKKSKLETLKVVTKGLANGAKSGDGAGPSRSPPLGPYPRNAKAKKRRTLPQSISEEQDLQELIRSSRGTGKYSALGL